MTGKTFVISAPSGTGKTTVCRMLLAQDGNLRFSVSHTTRKPRQGERDGDDYYFVDEAEFNRLVDTGAFLESARYAGNLYGTSFAAIRSTLEAGQDIMLEIEVQGAQLIRDSGHDAVFIFLLPPSMATLEQRLRDRGTDTEELIKRRLREGSTEVRMSKIFDYVVVNDKLDDAVAEVQSIIEAERNGKIENARARFGVAGVMAKWQVAEN
jgi:guanylate kinase